MTLRTIYATVERPFELLGKWVGFLGLVATIASATLQFLAWGNSGPFLFLRNNLYPIWLGTITVAALLLLTVVSRLNRRFSNRFSDRFWSEPRDNWDFEGPWRLAEKGTLVVTQSDAGGLSKVGAAWESYTFSFEARIITTCLGVVVRAADLNNYYMLQINPDCVRPHRRVAMPVAAPSPAEAPVNHSTTQPPYITFQVAWEVFESVPITPPLTGWFKVKLVVRGESVQLYIDDQLRFQRDAFVKIPAGKVGFRNAGNEEAYVRNVRVVVHP